MKSNYLGNKRSKKKESNLPELEHDHENGVTMENENDLEEEITTKVNYSHSLYLKKNLHVKKIFLYRPMFSLPILSNYVGELIEYRISHEYLNLKNKELKENRLFGSEIYTSDSDPILILMHLGCIELGNKYVNSEGNEDGGISLILRVGKGRVSYNSSEKNNVKSKKPNSYPGHSIKLEGFYLLNNLGSDEELIIYSSSMPLVENELENLNLICKDNYEYLPELEPYKLDYNIPLTFNLTAELVYRYDITLLSDNNKNKFKDFLSFKLCKHDLIVENHEERFRISKFNKKKQKSSSNILKHSSIEDNKELEKNIESSINFEDINDIVAFDEYHKYQISKVINLIPIMESSEIEQHNNQNMNNNIETNESIIHSNLDWSEMIWREEYIRVKDFFIRNPKSFIMIRAKNL